MERWRAAGPRRWVDGSNRTNRINESYRLARPCSPVKPYIYSTYKLTSVLLLYCAHVHRFWQNKTDPANRQIWFAIQFTTNPLDGGDFKRLCHGRTFLFVAASAATNRNFKTGEYPLFCMTRRTLRRQPRPAIRGRSETAIHKHAIDSNAPGRGHGRIQPFLRWSETAVTHATSYPCGAMWCGVGALRERRRAITALGRHIESNESNQRIRSARTAVSTCQTVYLQHIQIYQCFTTLLCSCS